MTTDDTTAKKRKLPANTLVQNGGGWSSDGVAI
jgi:hypothetical protein